MASLPPRLGALVPFKDFLKRAVYRRRLAAYRRALAAASDGPRVLVLMDRGIGNAVEATPLVQAIRTHWPRARITILPPQCDLFDEWCVVDEVARSREELAARAFDHVFVAWTAAPPGDLLAPRSGRVHEVRLRLSERALRPEREYDLDMLRRLGFEGEAPPRHVAVRKPVQAVAEVDLRICIVPGGLKTQILRHKRWRRFPELAALLLGRYPGAQLCILGTEADAVADEDRWPGGMLDVRGRLTMAEGAWVMRGASLVIGNDCGPMHVADAVGAPALVLFGPTCELKNGPANRGSVVALDLACRPCQFESAIDTCESPRCMEGLTPELVMERAVRILDAVGRASGPAGRTAR